MFRCLFRLIVLGILGLLVVAFLLPQFVAQAGNSLIQAFNNSAASGLAQFIPANFTDQQNHLQISVSGLSAQSHYYVTLDSGQCGGSPSQVIGLVLTDASGGINQEFTLGTFNTNQTWYIAIHQGSDSSGTIMACGQLTINGSSVATETTPVIILSPNNGGQTAPPTIANPTPTSTTPSGLPNTGVKPGNSNDYDNHAYPRKY